MTQAIPREWDVNRAARDALIELVLRRANYVADTVETRIWPQREMGYESDDQPEPKS